MVPCPEVGRVRLVAEDSLRLLGGAGEEEGGEKTQEPYARRTGQGTDASTAKNFRQNRHCYY